MLSVLGAAEACPFCTALKPTLAKQRDSASAVALGECATAPDAAAGTRAAFRVHQWFKAPSDRPATIEIPADRAAGCQRGGLGLLFDEGDSKWKALPTSEIAVAYFGRAPDARQPAAQRLPYFLRYLEHADPQIAEDAYLEFGLASFDDVRSVAGQLDSAALRRWLVDPQVPPERKGFYGVALGIAAQAQASASAANVAALTEQLDAKSSDFRAGFDGVLGGLLTAQGAAALAEIDGRYFKDPAAREGDVRHALSAARFAAEFLPEIPRDKIAAAVGHLLARREFAAEAIIDLARWEDWSAIESVATRYGDTQSPQPETNRAVVGYLSFCPREEAAAALEALRQRDPEGVKAAERVLRQLGRVRD